MTMDLLDLPPEIFGRVIARFVTDAGITVAWQCRKVCRTFRRSIEFETLAYQPTRAFLRTGEARARNILRNNMILYLSYRAVTLKGAYSFLPRFVKRVYDTISSGLPESDCQIPGQHARVLCRLLVKERQDVQALLMNKSPETSTKFINAVPDFDDKVSSNYIAAAAAVGNLHALRTAIRGDPDKLWEKSPAFGWPLVAAITGNQFEIVRAMIKHFEQSQHRTNIKYDESQFCAAIDVALAEDYRKVALLLLQIFSEYGSPVPKDQLTAWIEGAKCTRDGRIIREVYALKLEDLWNCDKELVEAYEEEDLRAVRMFINEGFVSRNCAMSHGSHCTPIQAAFDYSPEVMEEVFKLGANPNGCYVPSMDQHPLWHFIQASNEEAVRLLLQYGANPELILPLWNDQQDDFKESRAAIEALLVEAKDKHNYYEPPSRTQFAADAADLMIPEQKNGETSK